MTDALTLPPHQVEPSCPKCSSPKVDTLWHHGMVMRVNPYPCSHWAIEHAAQEHLCRACRTCGHSWATRTADAPEEPRGDL